MFLLFVFKVFCWRDPKLNLYTLIPGNWSQKIDGGIENKFEIKEISNIISETGFNISDFTGVINGTKITVSVTSNTTAIVTLNSTKFPVEFIDENFGVARSDYDINGTHISLTVNPRLSIEIAVVQKNQRNIITYAFTKPTSTDLSWKEIIVIFLI